AQPPASDGDYGGAGVNPEEAASLALARRHLKQRTDSARHTLALLAKAASNTNIIMRDVWRW
ncbi:hypothetical protein AAIH06_35415, partial [Pseudomonas aeruginosa]|uniref:hypothetical protein n=1 Tax=Pseudomonas aeruginosa TaxID=287 RepID=UPI0031B7C4B1